MADISRIPVRIRLEGLGETRGELIRFWAPRTVEAILQALPLEGKAAQWPGEIYFPIPMEMEEQDAQAAVPSGTIAFWPPGNSFCIFFGPTPMSRGDKPRAASPVNVVGRLLGDATAFRQVKDGTEITLTKAS